MNDMPSVTCPECHTKLNLSKIVEGAKITCPSCGAKFPLSAKKAGRTIHSADPIEDEEMEDDVANFLGDDPMVWIKMGIFVVLLLMPMMLVLIWSLSRRPSYMTGSALIDNRMIQPYSEEEDLSATAGTSRQGLPKITIKKEEVDSGWTAENFAMPLDRTHDKRLGVWTFGNDDDPQGYESISLEAPKETDTPPRQYVDGYFMGKQGGRGFAAARVTFWIVNTMEDGSPVRIQRQMVVPVWAHPLEPDGSLMRNKPYGIFHAMLPIPIELTKDLPFQGERFRNDFEVVTYVEGVQPLDNAYALMPTNNIKVTTRSDGITVVAEFENNTGKSLRDPLIAVDVYDHKSFFLGTFSGSGGFTVPHDKLFKIMIEIPYPDDIKLADPAGSSHLFNIKVRGLARG